MPSSTFSAPYDRTTKILSAVVCLALLAAVVAIQNLVGAVVSALVIVLAYAYSPQGYTVTDRAVVVKRRIGDVRVPLEAVLGVRPAASDDLRGCVRLWGSGGLFGYYGLFRTSKLGRCTWYATDRSRAVVLITTAKTVLFSPDDVDRFVAAIRQEAPSSDLSTATAVVLSSDRSRPSLLAAAAAPLLGLAGICFVVLAMLYNPGVPVYTLTADSLAIKDRFYPVTIGATSVEVSGIRVVDLDQEPGWSPVARVGGFANAHYQSGWYRAANGTRVRLYRTRDAQRLVLLPPKAGGAPVLLQVIYPDQFVQELRQEWARD